MKNKFLIMLLLTGILMLVPQLPVYASERVEIAPEGSSFKPYMSYKAITNTSSPQYFLQQFAENDIWGLRRLNGRLMIAVGSYYTTNIGTNIDIVLKNGNILECVLGDCKADKDTDVLHKVGFHNDTVEFIVDTEILQEDAKYHGDISKIIGFDSEVSTVIIYDTVTYIPSDPMLT